MTSKHGKLGNPDATLEKDPRLDRRLAAALLERPELPVVEPPPFAADYDTALTFVAAYEEAGQTTHDVGWQMMPDFPTVAQSTESVTGADGNTITLYIHRPKNGDTPIPAIVHTHGGGMALMTAEDPAFVRWRNSLASAGLLVVGVEFRNAAGRLGNHPFPAGLNDCARAVEWTHENKERLGISSIVVSGESGGGNLALATALKAKQEGWIDKIAGVYAFCPFISGAYADPPESFRSILENDDYLINRRTMSAIVTTYDPGNAHRANPLAWPAQATAEDLRGLPPHIVSVNELDPLRDEGLAYYRTLLEADVPAVGRTVHGTPHAGDLMFADVTPDIFEDTLNSICSFARRVSQG